MLSHLILISTYTQRISKPIVQNILYLQYIANNLPNAFTHQKCHQIIFLHVKCQRSEMSLNSHKRGRSKVTNKEYNLLQASAEIGGDILQDSKCKSTSWMLLDTLFIDLFESKAYECFAFKSPVYVHVN